MISILVNDIIPILVIMLLGYLCGKFYFFDNDQRQGLNKLVLDIALPAALFISIVKATRKMFAQDIVLTLISIVGVVGLFMLSYYLDKLLFHRTTQQAAVCALIAGSPTIGFLGFAVLDPIYGNNATTNLVIGIVSIVVNAITIPLGLALINKGQTLTKKKAKANPNNKGTKVEVEDIKGKGLNKTKKKVVVTIPDGVPVTDAEAKANAGVAVLAAGLALSTVKFSIDKEVIWNTFFRLFLTPAVIVAAAYLCGMGSDPTKISMLCLATGLPPAFSGIIISSRYNIYVKEGASSVAVSTVFFAVSCIFWIWLLPILAHMF